MDTNLLPHALILISAAFALAGMTQATHASLRRNRHSASALADQSARTATPREVSRHTGQGNRQKTFTYSKERLRVVRLQRAERQRLVLGVIAPDYVLCGVPPMPVRASGPPARTKLKSQAGNVWGDILPAE